MKRWDSSRSCPCVGCRRRTFPSERISPQIVCLERRRPLPPPLLVHLPDTWPAEQCASARSCCPRKSESGTVFGHNRPVDKEQKRWGGGWRGQYSTGFCPTRLSDRGTSPVLINCTQHIDAARRGGVALYGERQ